MTLFNGRMDTSNGIAFCPSISNQGENQVSTNVLSTHSKEKCPVNITIETKRNSSRQNISQSPIIVVNKGSFPPSNPNK